MLFESEEQRKVFGFQYKILIPTNLMLTTQLLCFSKLDIHKVFNHHIPIFVNKACLIDYKTFSLLCSVEYSCCPCRTFTVVFNLFAICNPYCK